MVLSRFWVFLVVSSIVYVMFRLVFGNTYSLDFAITGKKDDPMVWKEFSVDELPKNLSDSLLAQENKTWVVTGQNGAKDTTYILEKSTVKAWVSKQVTDGILPTCKNTIVDIVIPLVAYLAFFCGILQLLIDSGASEKLATMLSPLFVKVFPEVPRNHPSISYMMLNFAANFLGLDSAATPFGLKAMESLQEINPDKDKASNSQIMFMCLHAAGLTLIPTSIIGYRAAQNAANPADVMLPCIITSFIGTVAALVMVGIRQKINFKSMTLLLSLGAIVGIMAGLLFYIQGLTLVEKNHFTGNLSHIILLTIILAITLYAFKHEKQFEEKDTNIFSSFVNGASNGLKTGVSVFPYILGMLVAISLFRNSGLFEILSGWLAQFFLLFQVDKQIVDALPVALLRPFSSGGSRGFMLDAMRTYGADSLAGRLSCVFQCAAETTFYVIAVYFGSIKVQNTRYTLGVMLLTDLVCVLAAIGICLLFFGV